MEMIYDKINNDVAFREEDHKYFNVKYLDRQYTSVTTLISKYHEHFDEDFWSSYKACEKIMQTEFIDSGLKFELLEKKVFDIAYLDTFDIDHDEFNYTKQEIIDGYDLSRTVACERGTVYHHGKEIKFYDKPYHNVSMYGLGVDHLKGEFACERHNFSLNRETTVIPEHLVYLSTPDGVLNVAGQIDLLIKDGNDIYILDYKTNRKGIESKAYAKFDPKLKRKVTKKFFYPINNLDDHTLNKYTLQLSTYAYMLQHINPNFNIKMLRLIHIDGDGKETAHDVPYLKNDVDRMLKHFKKTLKVQHYRETGEII